MLAANYMRFASDGSGNDEYILPINPYNVTGFDTSRVEYLVKHEPLDGTSRHTYIAHDRTEKVLYFRYRTDQTALVNMQTELKSYEGNTRYFKDGVVGQYTSWTKMRIVSVERNVLDRYADELITHSFIVRMKLDG